MSARSALIEKLRGIDTPWVLWGPPGIGKSTLARLAGGTAVEYRYRPDDPRALHVPPLDTDEAEALLDEESAVLGLELGHDERALFLEAADGNPALLQGLLRQSAILGPPEAYRGLRRGDWSVFPPLEAWLPDGAPFSELHVWGHAHRARPGAETALWLVTHGLAKRVDGCLQLDVSIRGSDPAGYVRACLQDRELSGTDAERAARLAQGAQRCRLAALREDRGESPAWWWAEETLQWFDEAPADGLRMLAARAASDAHRDDLAYGLLEPPLSASANDDERYERLHHLILAEEAIGDPRRTDQWLHAANALEPSEPLKQARLGIQMWVHVWSGRLAQARSAAETLAQVPATAGTAQTVLGILSMFDERFDTARAHFERAAVLDVSRRPDARLWSAICAFRSGRAPEIMEAALAELKGRTLPFVAAKILTDREYPKGLVENAARIDSPYLELALWAQGPKTTAPPPLRRKDAVVLRTLGFEPTLEGFSVAEDGSSVQVGGVQHTIRSAPARRILRILEEARQSGRTVDAETLIARAWPGEMFVGRSGFNRLHVALSALRKAGLRSILTRGPQGYELRI